MLRLLVDELYAGRPPLGDARLPGPGARQLGGGARGRGAAALPPRPRATLRLPCVAVGGDHEAYLRGRRRGFLADLRRRRRRLAECGAVTFEACRAGRAAAPMLDELLVLEAAGWKAQRGTAIAGRPRRAVSTPP